MNIKSQKAVQFFMTSHATQELKDQTLLHVAETEFFTRQVGFC